MMSRGRSICARSVRRISIRWGFVVILTKSIRLKGRMGYAQFVQKGWGWIWLAILLCNMGVFSEYVQRRRRFRKGGSNSALSILRKELREGNFQSFLGGSSSLVSSSNTEPDPWLSSFIFKPPVDDEPTSVKLYSSNETSAATESSVQDLSERKTQQTPALSDKDQEEKAQKCEFVQGLLLSTFLNDDGL
ncbi:hypothetical protein LguiB_025593 [Lonicera macranthoides]